MTKNAFVKRVVVLGGFICLCAAPRLTLGQSSPPVAAPPSAIKPKRDPRATYISPSELLVGLTLTDDQQAKINQIREETKSKLSIVAKDEKLGPEVKEGMLGGYQRIENIQIFQVLTAQQRQLVRKRIDALQASAQQPQERSEQPTVAGRNNPQSK